MWNADESTAAHVLGGSLTEWKYLRYCSNVSMMTDSSLRAFGLVALLLPGLALAAPIAGPCGLCESGMPCPSMAETPSNTTGHGCCDPEPEEAPPAPALASSQCDCGRDAPPAVSSEPAPNPHLSPLIAARDSHVVAPPQSEAVAAATREERPPPATPPTFLLDCAFLT